MSSVVKQCIINRLDIPSDLHDIIKSYCFYDIKSWETIQFIRDKKEVINNIFKNNVVSRVNQSDMYVYDDDERHWVFWVDTEEDRDRCQFQGLNCLGCGNYDEVYAPDYISRKIICNCEDEYDSEDDASFGH